MKVVCAGVTVSKPRAAAPRDSEPPWYVSSRWTLCIIFLTIYFVFNSSPRVYYHDPLCVSGDVSSSFFFLSFFFYIIVAGCFILENGLIRWKPLKFFCLGTQLGGTSLPETEYRRGSRSCYVLVLIFPFHVRVTSSTRRRLERKERTRPSCVPCRWETAVC